MILCDLVDDLDSLKETIVRRLSDIKNHSYCSESMLARYQKIYGNVNPEEIFEQIKNWHKDYKLSTNYTPFASLLAKAEENLNKEKKLLGFNLPKETQLTNRTDKHPLHFLVDAFATKPVFQEINDDDKTIAIILQSYYRTPGKERVISKLSIENIPPSWKSIHSSSHAIRAYNNVSWYIELLEKFHLANFTEEEKTLLKLAIIYHDAAAEDVDKYDEEKQSALYFKRDLTGKFPQ